MRHWLMKSEPDVYSIDDLARDVRTGWEGVRNYQARNLLRDEMKLGDLVLFYHSNAEPPAVAGLARVCREAYPDETALDPSSKYHDPKSKPGDDRWLKVDVEFVEKFPRPVTLETLKSDPAFEGMYVIRRGMRLSVQPVEAAHFERVCALGRSA